jgi:hypothetical protein
MPAKITIFFASGFSVRVSGVSKTIAYRSGQADTRNLTPETLSVTPLLNPSYPAPNLLIIDLAAEIPDRKVGSNPLSPAQPPTKLSPLIGE